jgi:imidazolonepropionase-like amidohydrolase
MKLRVGILLVLPLLLSHVGPVTAAAEAPYLVLQGAKVYPPPAADPTDNAVVLIQNGRIAAVWRALKASKSTQVIDCTGKVNCGGG